MNRTDIAYEAYELQRKNLCETAGIIGVSAEERTVGGIELTDVKILNRDGEEALGKPKGRYITMDAPDLKYSRRVREHLSDMIRDTLSEIYDFRGKTVLCAGLGNRDITPDRTGTEAVQRLLITHHLKGNIPDEAAEGMGDMCAVIPGVLGTTGIESADIIKAAADRINPSVVICIDALAAADMKRVCRTIQINSSGIHPGSGVGNSRPEISLKTVGIPVIAIGVPTVVDVGTEDFPFMASPRDIDLLVESSAAVIAQGINMAVHRGLTREEIMEFTA